MLCLCLHVFSEFGSKHTSLDVCAWRKPGCGKENCKDHISFFDSYNSNLHLQVALFLFPSPSPREIQILEA